MRAQQNCQETQVCETEDQALVVVHLLAWQTGLEMRERLVFVHDVHEDHVLREGDHGHEPGRQGCAAAQEFPASVLLPGRPLCRGRWRLHVCCVLSGFSRCGLPRAIGTVRGLFPRKLLLSVPRGTCSSGESAKNSQKTFRIQHVWASRGRWRGPEE